MNESGSGQENKKATPRNRPVHAEPMTDEIEDIEQNKGKDPFWIEMGQDHDESCSGKSIGDHVENCAKT